MISSGRKKRSVSQHLVVIFYMARAVSTGGEMIAPLTYENALKWAEEYLTGDEVDEIFGISEDEPDDSRI